MTKKEKKWFSLSKNLNWEILTKNLVSFKRWDFYIMGECEFQESGVHEKTIYMGNCLKKAGMGGLGNLQI